jgi:hypothetical protein
VYTGFFADARDSDLTRGILNEKLACGVHHAHGGLGLAETGLFGGGNTESVLFGCRSHGASVMGKEEHLKP